MGFFSKLFKGPEIDMEKSRKNAEKMRLLFNQEVENGDTYRLIFGYTEDVSRFNYGFVHGSRTKIGNLIVGWNEDSQTIAVVPTVPDLSGCGTPVFTAGQRSLRPTGINIRRMHSSFIRIRKGISASTPTTGWRMRSCMCMWSRRRSWLPSQSSL